MTFNSFYNFLQDMGYPHPIHPTEVHMPIGLLVGGTFLLSWLAFYFHRPKLAVAARYCAIVAFIWTFPTILLGFMDWQHFYGGASLFPIKVKLSVAISLTLVLLIAVILGKKYGPESKRLLPVYTVAFCMVVVLGYYGGQLVFGNWSPEAPKEFQKGARVFKNDCSGCHVQGGNVVDPNLPLRSAPQLAHFNTFADFVRNPTMPNGTKGVMPAWPPSKLSEQEAQELYQYIVHVLQKPPRR
jgi:uncharacterized membrane protein